VSPMVAAEFKDTVMIETKTSIFQRAQAVSNVNLLQG
jgi:hypothetical protein